MAEAPPPSGYALVTGASAGLGAAFARSLAARGRPLLLVARRRPPMEALLAEARQRYGVPGEALSLDLTAEDAAPRLRDFVAGRPVEILVNNAGLGLSAPFLEADPERLRRIVRLNCEAPVLVARALLPDMVRRGRGSMIVVSSIAAFQPTPWVAVYGASKAFDLMWAEALAVELEGTGVRVLTLCPGHTRTEFHAVAGVDRPAAGARPAEPEEVVEETLRRLGRSRVLVPGAWNRWMMRLGALLPRRSRARAAGRLLRRRLEAAEGPAARS